MSNRTKLKEYCKLANLWKIAICLVSDVLFLLTYLAKCYANCYANKKALTNFTL